MTPIEVGNLLSERLGVRWSVRPSEPVSYYFHAEGPGMVVWNVKDGLTALLHEFGHAKRRAWFGPPNEADALEAINKDPLGFAVHRIEDEIAASLEAEKLAHELGLPFDYAAAEDALRSYVHTREGVIARIADPYLPVAFEWVYKKDGNANG